MLPPTCSTSSPRSRGQMAAHARYACLFTGTHCLAPRRAVHACYTFVASKPGRSSSLSPAPCLGPRPGVYTRCVATISTRFEARPKRIPIVLKMQHAPTAPTTHINTRHQIVASPTQSCGTHFVAITPIASEHAQNTDSRRAHPNIRVKTSMSHLAHCTWYPQCPCVKAYLARTLALHLLT